jgi:hypothetical protein
LTIRLIFLQIVFAYTFFNILSISTIIFPHFEYINIEELNEYVDRTELTNTISFITVIAGIPILVLPTVLYLTEYINDIFIYNMIQTYGITFVLILINVGIDIFIKKKVNSEKFIHSIFNN